MQVMELYGLISTLRSDAQAPLSERTSWTNCNLNKILTLANIGKGGMLDKNDLALRVQEYLDAIDKGASRRALLL